MEIGIMRMRSPSVMRTLTYTICRMQRYGLFPEKQMHPKWFQLKRIKRNKLKGNRQFKDVQ